MREFRHPHRIFTTPATKSLVSVLMTWAVGEPPEQTSRQRGDNDKFPAREITHELFSPWNRALYFTTPPCFCNTTTSSTLNPSASATCSSQPHTQQPGIASLCACSAFSARSRSSAAFRHQSATDSLLIPPAQPLLGLILIAATAPVLCPMAQLGNASLVGG